MFTTPLLFAALALIGAPLSLAFNAINTDSTITAGKDTAIHFVNDLSTGSQSFDGMFDSYRVYLSLTPPGWGAAPACFLVNSSAINVTSQTVQIPASVGPSNRSSQGYSIAAIEFNQDPNADGPSGFQYSNDFNFVGGTGNWSAYELAGYSVGIFDFTPCSAYDCARSCSQRYFPHNVNSISSYRQTYDCIAACPGATYPPFDSIYGGGGGGGGGGGSGGSSSSIGPGGGSIGPSLTTSLAAAGGFTQVMSSSTSAASGSPSVTGGTASITQASSTAPSSGTPTGSSTASASTPTTSKSAATPHSSTPQSAFFAAGVALLFGLFSV